MTKYYQCVSCAKTSTQENCVIKTDGNFICPHCLNAVKFAFSACTADQPEPSLGFCDGCDELEAELHLMDGDWLCDKCKATVIAVQEDKAKAKEIKTKPEMNWLKLWTWVAISLGCVGFWAGVIHFVWGYYVP